MFKNSTCWSWRLGKKAMSEVWEFLRERFVLAIGDSCKIHRKSAAGVLLNSWGWDWELICREQEEVSITINLPVFLAWLACGFPGYTCRILGLLQSKKRGRVVRRKRSRSWGKRKRSYNRFSVAVVGMCLGYLIWAS